MGAGMCLGVLTEVYNDEIVDFARDRLGIDTSRYEASQRLIAESFAQEAEATRPFAEAHPYIDAFMRAVSGLPPR